MTERPGDQERNILVLKNVPVSSKQAQVDAVVVRFPCMHCQTYHQGYPATDFSNGITNITKILAAERIGMMFLFVILLQNDEGWEILESVLHKMDRTNLHDIIDVFEAFLCFDQWLKQSSYWKAANHAEASANWLQFVHCSPCAMNTSH